MTTFINITCLLYGISHLSNLFMRTSITALLLFLSIQGAAQNAFFDTRKIVKWHLLKDSDTAKANQAKEILTCLLFYANNDNRLLRDSNNLFINRVYHTADTLYSNKEKKRIGRDAILSRILNGNENKISSTIVPYRKENKLYDSLLFYFDSSFLKVKTFIKNNALQEGVNVSIDMLNNVKGNAILRDLYQEEKYISVTSIASIQLNPDSTVAILDQLTEKMLVTLRTAKKMNEDSIFNLVMNIDAKSFREMFEEIKIDGSKLGDLKEGAISTMQDANRHLEMEQQRTLQNIELSRAEQIIAAPNLVDQNSLTSTDVIDKFATYLANRTKREAALFFMENLTTALKVSQLAQEIFPQTWEVIQNMESYITPRFGSKWRHAIASDYVFLPQHIRSSKFIQSRFTNKIVYNHFSDAITFAEYVGKKYSFPDIITLLFNDHSKLKGKWTSIGVDVLYIINSELRDSTTVSFKWIRPEQFLSLTDDGLMCLFDLIKIRYKDKVGRDLKEIFNKPSKLKFTPRAYQLFYAELLTMLKQFNNIQNISAQKSADGTIITSDGFWDSQRNFIDFLLNQELVSLTKKEKQALQLCKSGFYVYDYLSNRNYAAASEHVFKIIGDLIQKNTKELIELTAKDLNFLQLSNPTLLDRVNNLNSHFADLTRLQSLSAGRVIDTAGRVQEKDLIDEFMFNDTTILQRLLSNSILDTAKLKIITGNLRDSVQAYYEPVITKLNSSLSEKVRTIFGKTSSLDSSVLNYAYLVLAKSNNNFFKWLSDFSGLLTEIAATTKPEELSNIIESYALPPGSYRIKRNANFSIDLNAFTGFYAGGEVISGSNQPGFVYGFTAPIGVAFSWGLMDDYVARANGDAELAITRKGLLRRRTQNSFTLDLTLVDLGAFVSYRFSNEAEGLPEKVSWEQIISVGLNARWGLKKTPFCFGIGLQQTPRLRTIKLEQKRTFRASVTFTFDLPLISIYKRM